MIADEQSAGAPGNGLADYLLPRNDDAGLVKLRFEVLCLEQFLDGLADVDGVGFRGLAHPAKGRGLVDNVSRCRGVWFASLFVSTDSKRSPAQRARLDVLRRLFPGL